MTYAAKHFTAKEWRCKCGQCGGRSATQPLSDQLLVRLDLLRAALGAPITITSGWRCEAHNAATPGASARSYHLQGRAADITADEFAALTGIARRIGELYLYKWTELLVYPDRRYLHVAV